MQLDPPLDQRFAERMGQLLGPDFPTDLCLAVSGGADSMAMLHLAAGWARVYGVALRVATVDHRLRSESADEARMVADEARGLGLTHDTLVWNDVPKGNLQDAARRARLSLLTEWAGTGAFLALGHTADDQAETLLMRLARGSGVDGLAAMRPLRRHGEVSLLRPLLDERRSALRHYVRILRIPFADDPGNDDPTYARVRTRHLIGREGLDVATLTDTARRMNRARAALQNRAVEAAARLAVDLKIPGTIAYDRDGFAALDEETQMRLLAGALQLVSSAAYRPREAALVEARDILLSGGRATLHGCLATATRDRLMIFREPKAVADLRVPMEGEAVWDRSWLIRCDKTGLTVAALGAAGAQALRDAGSFLPEGPARAFHALPALWRGDTLAGFQPAGFGPAYDMRWRHPGGKLSTVLKTD